MRYCFKTLFILRGFVRNVWNTQSENVLFVVPLCNKNIQIQKKITEKATNRIKHKCLKGSKQENHGQKTNENGQQKDQGLDSTN